MYLLINRVINQMVVTVSIPTHYYIFNILLYLNRWCMINSCIFRPSIARQVEFKNWLAIAADNIYRPI